MVIKHIVRSKLFTSIFIVLGTLMMGIGCIQGIIYLDSKENLTTTRASFKIIGTMTPTIKNHEYKINYEQIKRKTNLQTALYGYDEIRELESRYEIETLDLREHVGGYSSGLSRVEENGVKNKYDINSDDKLVSGKIEDIIITEYGNEYRLVLDDEYKEEFKKDSIKVKDNFFDPGIILEEGKTYFMIISKENEEYHTAFLDYELPIYIDITGLGIAEIQEVTKEHHRLYDIKAKSLEAIFTKNFKLLKPVYEGLVYLSEGKSFDNLYGKSIDVGSAPWICMISDLFAKENHLKLGDKIELSFYEGDFISLDNRSVKDVRKSHPLSSTYEYEIVGIYSYTSNDFSGPFDINPNTIFFPEYLFPEEISTEYLRYIPNQLTFLIDDPNNVEEVEALLTEVFEDRAEITYFDEDSINVRRILENAMSDIQKNMILVTVFYILIIGLLVAMYYRLQGKEIALKRSFGVSEKKLRKENHLELILLYLCNSVITIIIYFTTHERIMIYYLNKKEIRDFVPLSKNIIFGLTNKELIVLPLFIIGTFLYVIILNYFLSKRQFRKSIVSLLSEKI